MFKPKVQHYSVPYPNKSITRVFGNPPNGAEDALSLLRNSRTIYLPRGEALKKAPFLFPDPKLPPSIRRAQIAKKGWHTFQTIVLEAHEHSHLRSSFPDSSDRKVKKKKKR